MERVADEVAADIESRRLPGYAGVVAVEGDGTIRYVSDELDGRFGISTVDALGVNFIEYVATDDANQAVESFGGVAGREGHHQAIDIQLRSPDGTMSMVDVVAENCLTLAGLGFVLLNIGDPTDRRRSVQLLDAQAEIVRKIALGSSLPTSLDEIIGFVERALPGYRAAAYLLDDIGQGRATAAPSLPAGMSDRLAAAIRDRASTPGAMAIAEEETIVAVDLAEPRWSAAAEALAGTASSVWAVPIRHERGAFCHGCVEIYGPDPSHPRDEDWAVLHLASRLAAVAIDRVAMQDDLLRQARVDPLTGAPNRRVIEASLAAILDGSSMDRRRAICFIDLDHLKVVNDGLGHEAGDLVIAEAARRLAEHIGPLGVVGRFGGDEFVAIAARPTTDHRQLADRCLAAFADPLVIAGRRWHLSASVGVVVIDRHATPGEVLRDADAAMYEAKRAGRGRWHLFEQATRESVVRRFRLEQQLRHAVATGRIEAWFQPVVDAATRQVRGLEALARWEIEPGRWVDPSEFIPLAEEVGLIDQIGVQMVDHALAALREASAAGIDPLVVSVNVSPIQLQSELLFDRLRSAAADEPVSSLCLEMTEQHVIDDRAQTMVRLKQLLATGAGLAVDDFGTGYSSLGALHRLPASTLKIDRKLVEQVGTDEGDAVVAAAVGVASAYRMSTIAEGVETSDQATRVCELGVTALQGYLIARPAPLGIVLRRVAAAGSSQVRGAEAAVGASGR